MSNSITAAQLAELQASGKAITIPTKKVVKFKAGTKLAEVLK